MTKISTLEGLAAFTLLELQRLDNGTKNKILQSVAYQSIGQNLLTFRVTLTVDSEDLQQPWESVHF